MSVGSVSERGVEGLLVYSKDVAGPVHLRLIFTTTSTTTTTATSFTHLNGLILLAVVHLQGGQVAGL